jgi:hypothetical protein
MRVKKWLPCSMWDFTGLQDWLNEQAAAGYALLPWPGVWDIGRISFVSDETARSARYRLEPVNERMSPQERNELYAQSGWNYVTDIHQLYTVYRCDDPEAPELYADAESLSLTFKKLIHRQWWALFFTIIWAGWLMREEIVKLFTAPALLPLRVILSTEVMLPLYLILYVGVAVVLVRAVRRTGTLRGLRRQLAAGIFPKAGKRRYQELWRDNLLLLAMFFCMVYLVFLGMSGDRRTYYLENESAWDFPHVTLTEVLPKGSEVRWYSDKKMLHSDKFSHSLLAPEQYDVAQGGMVTLPDSTQEEARIYLEYFRTASPAVAEALYHGKIAERQREIEEYRKNWEENTGILHVNEPNAYDYIKEETSAYEGLDALYRFTYLFSDRELPNVYFVGLVGDRVFTLSCPGVTDGEAALALLTERLAAED